jgi:protoheme IX farnesyltransferase
MALVVTAPSPIEARASLAATTISRLRLTALLRWVTLSAAMLFALSLVAEGVARFAQPWGSLDAALIVMTTAALGAVVAVGALTWLACRTDGALLLLATLAVVLAAVRVLAAALLTALDLPTYSDVAAQALGFMVLGCLVWSATLTARTAAARRAAVSAETELFRRVVDVTVFLVFAAGLTGVTVRAVGASWACQGPFPDCNGLGVLPIGRDPLADIQLYHRLLAYVALALVAWVTIEALRSQRYLKGAGHVSLALLGTTLAQGAIGALSVSIDNPPLMQVLHLAGATASWSAAIVLAALIHRPTARGLPLTPTLSAPRVEGVPTTSPPMFATPRPWREEAARGASAARTLSAYVQLTKPRVMSLLLATTATAMVIAARGMPDVGIFVATLLGGALMSGGAGAINHYVDRDIDPLMGRTAWRPIPSGVISPRRALWFGIGLAILASAVFVVFVNILACVLAVLGLLGYVFIYTLWLKRSTPSNIVIGGAAGAIPPLVGWAAVTNEISSLTAWYLFAIIFFWTPPHFWALSLLIRKHYERAGVPMLPVVRGEDETRRQIVLYSVLLVVLTLVLSPFGMMGVIYFAAAGVLGGLFIVDAVRLWRQATPQAARRLYLYSILYLFALFTAMAVDRVVS